MTIKFRLATRADLPRIVAIYNESIPSRLATADLTPVSVADRQAWFAAFDPTSRPIWVFTQDSVIAGWVSLESFYGRPAYYQTAEISIYIANDFHHQGLGQRALDFVFGQLDTLGIKTVVAYIFHHNQPSQGLFHKNGFTTWGHLPDVAVMDGQLRSLDILGRRFHA
ncbi:GNAT family N-acetyltransferase [Levilactobacillus acidifarinae]|uniref:Phosphinothricin N-acetyltransferase n=1 Tax=Levilactobacillus acidifarinae DSM 19394 = JCM 15949 TaxID=1423715 RepID=A0A0R1LEL9_9LACO|nr:GNAT family N-acetyltransferase [Levilactobacillus acidifarinae]KRK94005.1 phosphinothricin N-acetyltransferase [Levilactobacillus acidifarinae DSM 19394]GEO68892.1 phosphinothricin acetyltransferase [Levilactobacillus acidifarinae]